MPDSDDPVSQSHPKLLSTRTLLVCAALGVVCGIFAQLSRVLGLVIQATVPWLSFPAPLPWFLGAMIAAALFRRPGVAIMTSFVGMIVSVGGPVLTGGLIIELVFLITRYRKWNPSLFFIAAALIAVMNFGFMYLYADFTTLPPVVQAVAFVVRLLVYLAYAWLALWLTTQLERAGIATGRPKRS